jgi:16S rRNA (adenine1518-N6/adenine1519-N6)-dimethyltransferase
MLVMVQKEVAERFVAPVRTPAYGAVSVKIAYWATSSIVGDVPASVFFPKPNVASSLVDIKRRTSPAVPDVDPTQFFTLVRTGFGQRRKMLRQSLKGVAGALEALNVAGIAEDRRPETVTISEWCALAKEVG